MFSARSLFQEIIEHDESYRLFCSVAAGGEAQGGWENGRIAALLPASLREPAPKVTRHGADEDKHGRIFHALLRKRGPTPVEVPAAIDHTMLLERRGIGLAHDRLRRDEPLGELDIVTYLAHSRVTEQRAADQMGLLEKCFGDHPEVGRAIRRILRDCALAETGVHRDVSLAVLDRMGRILGWSAARSAVLATAVRTMHGHERLGGWRCMTGLRMPERRDVLGGPATGAPEYA
ncbi:ferritin-like domain-containing protein [Streptomyces kasugaensis]|uniref:Ferritin-like domain-containing protein n=1 Tax=Streptomyces kasugaensis TaxID=1946 RepID=A0A4Q9HNZ9_STRKA|nr:ferritin-like domain-containing protein [Streptomyces kasugaensis]TBO56596.1 ferritin-like domain-containing protein [Streptomyces kasugaensis]